MNILNDGVAVLRDWLFWWVLFMLAGQFIALACNRIDKGYEAALLFGIAPSEVGRIIPPATSNKALIVTNGFVTGFLIAAIVTIGYYSLIALGLAGLLFCGAVLLLRLPNEMFKAEPGYATPSQIVGNFFTAIDNSRAELREANVDAAAEAAKDTQRQKVNEAIGTLTEETPSDGGDNPVTNAA